jgi:hypothetical protein
VNPYHVQFSLASARASRNQGAICVAMTIPLWSAVSRSRVGFLGADKAFFVNFRLPAARPLGLPTRLRATLTPYPPRALTERALANEIAFARLPESRR